MSYKKFIRLVSFICSGFVALHPMNPPEKNKEIFTPVGNYKKSNPNVIFTPVGEDASFAKSNPSEVFILYDRYDSSESDDENNSTKEKSSLSRARTGQHHGSKTTHSLKGKEKVYPTHIERTIVQQDNRVTALNTPAIKSVPLTRGSGQHARSASQRESSDQSTNPHNNSFNSKQSPRKDSVYYTGSSQATSQQSEISSSSSSSSNDNPYNNAAAAMTTPLTTLTSGNCDPAVTALAVVSLASIMDS